MTEEHPSPGMIYVKDRKADSICETELALAMTKSPYISTHFCGDGMFSGIRAVTRLKVSIILDGLLRE
jgi:hypothetical protein